MKNHLKKLLIPLLAAAALTAAAMGGLLYRADNLMCDGLYQSPSALSGSIVIIGIDERAIADIGPYPWSRSVMAEAIEALNADAASRPAVIGIDVLYVGEGDVEADESLVRAAAEAGNVVTACAANFGSELIVGPGGDFYMDDYAIKTMDEPFEALRAVTAQGHINSMLDGDGVLRHAIYTISPDDGREIPSFSRVIYEKYARSSGLPLGIAPKTDARGRWYVPFSALPGDYSDSLSVSDLLAGEIPPDMYAGKIVLIGPYAVGLQDSFTTSVARAEQMYGVEYQANLIEAMLAEDYKSEAPDLPQALALFAVSALCLYLFLNKRLLHATLIWLAVSAGWVGVCALAYSMGLVLHVSWIPLSVTALYICAIAANYVTAALERRRVTNTFKRYVAPEIVGEILKEGPEALSLGGSVRDIAVLFVDIRGFTSLSEALEPEQVVEILNSYLELAARCIVENGGTLDKFIGDAAMAFWGAPIEQEDYIFKAVKAAVDMQRGAEPLGKELIERFGRGVSFGVGVHCGKAVVGNIGAKMRMDYTAIGDTVNTASRLESNAPAGKILISRAVADALEGRIRAESLGGVKLKGKAGDFEALTLEGLIEEERQ